MYPAEETFISEPIRIEYIELTGVYYRITDIRHLLFILNYIMEYQKSNFI